MKTDKGTTFTYGDIPAELVETAEEWRQNMIEGRSRSQRRIDGQILGR